MIVSLDRKLIRSVALVATLTALGLAGCTPKQEPPRIENKPAEATMKEVRKKAAHRQRRIIFNNDGNEPAYLCQSVSKDELLGHRTRDLAGTQVDSIFYCTWSSDRKSVV